MKEERSPLILVTGATGYIASRLIPRLLESGYRVRCLAREPLRLKGRNWVSQVEVVQGDVTVPTTLAAALRGVHTAYYLIHNMTHGQGYTSLELDSARTFAAVAAKTGVEHIIYLGGLADPEQHIAPHMRSRIETGRVLREGSVPVTEFRAGVITGSGSISFEMIRFMTELFPIVPGPLWLKNKSQPIAIQNVIDYLLAALTNPDGRGGVYEIGGPDVTSYGDLMLRYAQIRGLKRRMLLMPGLPVWFMAFGVGMTTPVPYPIAYALIGGLSADSVVRHPAALTVFPDVKLISFDSAARDALERTHPPHIEPVWDDGAHRARLIKHEGCFVLHGELQIEAKPDRVQEVLQQFVRASAILKEGKRTTDTLVVCAQNQIAGGRWIEWRVRQAASVTYIAQTIFFCPRGLPGFLYWYLLYPFHWMRFRSLMRRIVESAQDPA
ncbi:MAG TPA: NmrA family NAD(P)-binding protein [Anaerolineales bacterium]|nr:NmrA family NAD(P)-binding protein [Anaerolineales bacterium]